MRRILSIVFCLAVNFSQAQDTHMPVLDLQALDSLYRLVPPRFMLDFNYSRKDRIYVPGYGEAHLNDTSGVKKMSSWLAVPYHDFDRLLKLAALHQVSYISNNGKGTCHGTTVVSTGKRYSWKDYFIRPRTNDCPGDKNWIMETEDTLATYITSGTYKHRRDTRIIQDTIVEPFSRWPFLGPGTPPFLGITAGLEGFPATSYTIGIFHSHLPLSTYGDLEKTGFRTGYGIYFKKHMNQVYPWTIEADLGIYGVIAMGININYNRLNDQQKIVGFKPYIGLSFFHFDFLYGYNFFSNKKDRLGQLDHHRFTMRLTIPIAKLSKEKTVTHYVYKDWDEEE